MRAGGMDIDAGYARSKAGAEDCQNTKVGWGRTWRNRVADNGPANRRHSLQVGWIARGTRQSTVDAFERAFCDAAGTRVLTLGLPSPRNDSNLARWSLQQRLQGWPMVFKRSLHPTKLQVVAIFPPAGPAVQLMLCPTVLDLHHRPLANQPALILPCSSALLTTHYGTLLALF